MAAYMIAFVEMLDEKVFRDYQGVASDAFGAYGAKFLTPGGSHKVLEGPAEDRTCVLVEFPSAEQAQAFWDSPEYQAAIKMREGAANMQVLLLDGG
jgi:uncharacterized protein (DUF1330 family)